MIRIPPTLLTTHKHTHNHTHAYALAGAHVHCINRLNYILIQIMDNSISGALGRSSHQSLQRKMDFSGICVKTFVHMNT